MHPLLHPSLHPFTLQSPLTPLPCNTPHCKGHQCTPLLHHHFATHLCTPPLCIHFCTLLAPHPIAIPHYITLLQSALLQSPNAPRFCRTLLQPSLRLLEGASISATPLHPFLMQSPLTSLNCTSLHCKAPHCTPLLHHNFATPPCTPIRCIPLRTPPCTTSYCNFVLQHFLATPPTAKPPGAPPYSITILQPPPVLPSFVHPFLHPSLHPFLLQLHVASLSCNPPNCKDCHETPLLQHLFATPPCIPPLCIPFCTPPCTPSYCNPVLHHLLAVSPIAKPLSALCFCSTLLQPPLAPLLCASLFAPLLAPLPIAIPCCIPALQLPALQSP